MTSILFLTKAIQFMFRCNYLRNEKRFLYFFFLYLKFILNFEIFQKKDEPQSWCIFLLTDSKQRGYINV